MNAPTLSKQALALAKPVAPGNKPGRIEQITITRFVVALTVIFFHYGKDIYPLNTYVIGRVLLAGPEWVSYFFVLMLYPRLRAFQPNMELACAYDELVDDYLPVRISR